MPRAPLLSGKEIIKALAQIGYRPIRQRGSHIRLSNPNKRSLTVPDYKVISKALLHKILRDAELPLVEFNKLIEK